MKNHKIKGARNSLGQKIQQFLQQSQQWQQPPAPKTQETKMQREGKLKEMQNKIEDIQANLQAWICRESRFKNYSYENGRNVNFDW